MWEQRSALFFLIKIEKQNDKILVVEDEINIGETFGDILESNDIEVVRANNGLEK